LFLGSKATAVQYGVVSFGGSKCIGEPDVYTSVSYFRSWVVAQTVHTVFTACAGCAHSTNWIALCQSIGGTYKKIPSGYQCQNLDVLKTRTVDFSWTGCTVPEKDLCQKIGLYTCASGIARCATL